MRSTLCSLLVLSCAATAHAADPPASLNYQGVLRDASGVPLSGTYDVIFRFHDAASGGAEILTDRHLVADGLGLTAAGGLFSAALGGGTVVDGAGPGSYTSLAEVFRDHGQVWLQIEIAGEVLLPRVRVRSAAYALNAAHLGGRPAAQFVDVSSAAQTKTGPLTVQPADPVTIAVSGLGANTGAYFESTGALTQVTLADGTFAVNATGNDGGGLFLNSSGSQGRVAYGPLGVQGFGSLAGGSFADLEDSGFARVAYGDRGIEAQGSEYGGYFSNLTGTLYAALAGANFGIDAGGTDGGGRFTNTGFPASQARLAYGPTGVQGFGSAYGGLFTDTDSSGSAWVGRDDRGIDASGNEVGGYFADANESGLAFVGYGGRGIWGKGLFAGATFSHPDNVTYWSDVATISGGTTYKIRGTGTVAFVQNHPYDDSKVVVYAAPEAGEVAVYTRGSARLVDGTASVQLDPTFSWVANPDAGLTAHLTPRATPVPLAVTALDAATLAVRGPAGSDAEFDYLVYGLRIGFERHAAVQPRDRDALLPPADAAERFFAEHPDLVRFTADERFRDTRRRLGRAEPDPARAHALAAAIDGDRVAAVERARDADVPTGVAGGARRPADPPAPRSAGATAVGPGPVVSTTQDAPIDPDARFTDAPATARFAVTEAIESGDLLALDPDRAGALRRARGTADPLIVGVAVASSVSGAAGSWVTVATYGVAEVRVDAGFGEIRPGDLLAASPTPGHAARSVEPWPGTVLGKSLDAFPAGTGTVRVLLMAR